MPYWHDLPFSPNNITLSSLTSMECSVTWRLELISHPFSMHETVLQPPPDILNHGQTSLWMSWYMKPPRVRVYTRGGWLFSWSPGWCSTSRGAQSRSALRAARRGGQGQARRKRRRLMPKTCDGSCSGCGLCQVAALWCNHWWCEPAEVVETGNYCWGEKRRRL